MDEAEKKLSILQSASFLLKEELTNKTDKIEGKLLSQ